MTPGWEKEIRWCNETISLRASLFISAASAVAHRAPRLTERQAAAESFFKSSTQLTALFRRAHIQERNITQRSCRMQRAAAALTTAKPERTAIYLCVSRRAQAEKSRRSTAPPFAVSSREPAAAPSVASIRAARASNSHQPPRARLYLPRATQYECIVMRFFHMRLSAQFLAKSAQATRQIASRFSPIVRQSLGRSSGHGLLFLFPSCIGELD